MTIPEDDSDLAPRNPADPGGDLTDSADEENEISDLVAEFVGAIEDGARSIREARRSELLEAFDGEEFANEGLTYREDAASYDQTAYTKTREQNLESYRYNLKSGAYSGTSMPEEEIDEETWEDVENAQRQGNLLDDPGISAVEDDGYEEYGGRYGYGSYGYGSYGYGKTGKGKGGSAYGTGSYGGGYGYGGAGSYGGWLSGSAYGGTGSWMNSWYSGYTSTGSALRAVHQNVATFIEENKQDISLEIIPDLEASRGHIIASVMLMEQRLIDNKESRTSLHFQEYLTYAIRIDSTLYEKLGIEEAQQHYIVDGISQVLAIQQYPDPATITYIHGCLREEDDDEPMQACPELAINIPNVLRELITEIARANGVPLLLEKMPGWQKRVSAFRSVMYIGEPPNNDIPTAYLMYAVWERDVIESVEHQDAVEVINKIEEMLNAPLLSGKFYTASQLHSARIQRIKKIELLVLNYITGFGPIGRIVKTLEEVKSGFEGIEKIKPWRVAKDAEVKKAKSAFTELIPLVHEHNRTFAPDPSKPLEIRHQDFPECPSRELLSEKPRKRYELARMSLFTLIKAPSLAGKPNLVPDSSDPPKQKEDHKNLRKAITQIATLLNQIGDSSAMLKAAEEAAQKARAALKGISDRARRGGRGDGDPDGENPVDKTGANCTKHPELRHRGSVSSGVNRQFSAGDPELDRPVVFYDFSIS